MSSLDVLLTHMTMIWTLQAAPRAPVIAFYLCFNSLAIWLVVWLFIMLCLSSEMGTSRIGARGLAVGAGAPPPARSTELTRAVGQPRSRGRRDPAVGGGSRQSLPSSLLLQEEIVAGQVQRLTAAAGFGWRTKVAVGDREKRAALQCVRGKASSSCPRE